MFALFDDAGKFHAGRVMSETDSSLQVELDSGKRVKVKAANVLLKFEQPQPQELMTGGNTAHFAGRLRPALSQRLAAHAKPLFHPGKCWPTGNLRASGCG